MNWFELKQKYSGNWENDKPNGLGDLIWLEEKGLNKAFRNRYSGQFLDNKRNGLGKFFYANGSIFEGEWLNNLKHGYGVFIDEDSNLTYGIFKDDKLDREFDKIEGFFENLP